MITFLTILSWERNNFNRKIKSFKIIVLLFSLRFTIRISWNLFLTWILINYLRKLIFGIEKFSVFKLQYGGLEIQIIAFSFSLNLIKTKLIYLFFISPNILKSENFAVFFCFFVFLTKVGRKKKRELFLAESVQMTIDIALDKRIWPSCNDWSLKKKEVNNFSVINMELSLCWKQTNNNKKTKKKTVLKIEIDQANV